MTRRFHISTSHQRIAVVSHAVETGKATRAALSPSGTTVSTQSSTSPGGPRAGDRSGRCPSRCDRPRSAGSGSRRPRATTSVTIATGMRGASSSARTSARPRSSPSKATKVPVPSSPDCSLEQLVEDARRRVDPDAGIRRERELRGGGREEDRDQRGADGDLPASRALQRRRRSDQEQWDDVEQVAVANDRLAEADAERRRLEREEGDRDQRERRERVLVLCSRGRTSVASIHPPPRISGTSPHPIATASRWRPADDQTPEGSREPSSTVTA